jgi:hypothetical protein
MKLEHTCLRHLKVGDRFYLYNKERGRSLHIYTLTISTTGLLFFYKGPSGRQYGPRRNKQVILIAQ